MHEEQVLVQKEFERSTQRAMSVIASYRAYSYARAGSFDNQKKRLKIFMQHLRHSQRSHLCKRSSHHCAG